MSKKLTATPSKDQIPEGSNGGGAYHEPGRRAFAANNPGRPRGIKDRRAQTKEAFLELIEAGDPELGLKPRRERIADLLTCADLNVRITAEKFFFDHSYGKAKESVDVFHRFQAIDEASELMDEHVWQGRDVTNLPPRGKSDVASGRLTN